MLSDINPLLEPILDFIKGGGASVDALFTVPFGSGGPKEYFFRLVKIIRSSHPSFGPDEFASWETAQRDDLRSQADEQIRRINAAVLRHVFTVFRKIYGTAKNAYWEKGVTSKDIKANAYKKSMDYDSDERADIETYLDFIELKKIVEKEHWRLFKSVLDIPLPGVKGVAKNIEWMERINELRRISAHPGDGRTYKSEDFPIIDAVCTTLENRLARFDYEAVAVEGLATGD